jgi:hypothetical protein
MAVRLSALHAGRPLPPKNIPGTHFCYRLSRPQGHSTAGRIRSIEKKIHLIETRTRDLPACSIVPQPTTLVKYVYINIKIILTNITELLYYGVIALHGRHQVPFQSVLRPVADLKFTRQYEFELCSFAL